MNPFNPPLQQPPINPTEGGLFRFNPIVPQQQPQPIQTIPVQQQQQPIPSTSSSSVQPSGEAAEINVGGRKFVTTIKTLKAIPIFKELSNIPTLKNRKPSNTQHPFYQPPVVVESKGFPFGDYFGFDEEGNLFVDLNGELFEAILDWVRYSHVPELSINNLTVKQLIRLKTEARFYRLDDLITACHNRLEELGSAIEKQKQPTSLPKEQPSIINPIINPIIPSVGQSLNTTNVSGMQLVALHVKNTNQSLFSANPGIEEMQVIPSSVVEFDIPKEGYLLIEYYIADSCGDYVIVLDGINQKPHPALSGIEFVEMSEVKISRLEFAFTQPISFVTSKSVPQGKHTVGLRWRPYKKIAYTIQGPLICKIFLVDSNLVRIN